MICPRCGAFGPDQTGNTTDEVARCARCAGSLAPGAPQGPPIVVRAPTHRGELAQLEAGLQPVVLARPRPPRPVEETVPATPVVEAVPPVPSAEAPGWVAPPFEGGDPAPVGGGAGPAVPVMGPRPPSTWPPPPIAPGAGGAPVGHSARAGAHSSGVTAGPPSYMWQSVFCLLLFAPAAIVALYYSVRVGARMAVDDWRGALRASRLARTWCLVSLLGGLVAVVLATAGLMPTFSTR